MAEVTMTADVTMTLLTAVPGTAKSLSDRVRSLAQLARIPAHVQHVATKDLFHRKLKELSGQHVCIYCEITDGSTDTADDLRDYLTGMWQGALDDIPDAWLRQRPIIIMSNSKEIVKALKKVERTHPRNHSLIIDTIPAPGANRWRDIRDALLDSLRNA